MSATPNLLPLICVVYDGIQNPVFYSQVLMPLQKTHRTTGQPITIISFEYKLPENRQINNLQQEFPFITFVWLKKQSFWGMRSLYLAVRQLRNYLHSISPYELLARGAFAGYLCLQAAHHAACTKLTIQARGLLAAEYEYTHALHKGLTARNLIHALRLNMFRRLEEKTYATVSPIPTTIEAVSEALKTYLIEHFNCHAQTITIAENDIPKSFSREQIDAWRAATRTELCLSGAAKVFCYNGSAKPWQCPNLTLEFFCDKLAKNPLSTLLIISQDHQEFIRLLAHYRVPPHSYRLVSVNHADVYRYLSAADAGLIFREQHIMNWISRPTKALEYAAIGLPILHNNTVGSLAKKILSELPSGRKISIFVIMIIL